MIIDLEKEYQTVSGKRVIGLKYVPKNSNGKFVTFPIKGSVVVREKPLKLEYNIWMSNGQFDVCNPDHNMNLVEVKNG
jgi:hypothetical protein